MTLCDFFLLFLVLLHLLSVDSTLDQTSKRFILDAINSFRDHTALGETGNQPRAKNMNYLWWDSALASVANNYAQNCIYDSNKARNSEFFAIKEVKLFLIFPKFVQILS